MIGMHQSPATFSIEDMAIVNYFHDMILQVVIAAIVEFEIPMG